jgi:hypothetical protein
MEASEEVNALFGYMSPFHAAFGFFIDGVDETTAILPPGWRERSQSLQVADGGTQIKAVAPSLDDLIVSKLHRLGETDRAYIAACHAAHPLDIERLKNLLGQCRPDPALAAAAVAFLDGLRAKQG